MAPAEAVSPKVVKVKKEKKEKKDKSENKEKTEKKEKKEKSSKKRKAEATEDEVPIDTAASIEPSTTEDMIIDASESPESVEDETSEVPSAKKRKMNVEDIEVDITLPEPPSKKALRALKKGKSLPPSKSGAETTPEPTKKPEVEKRSEHGIWIGNLAFHVSKADLRTFFTEKSDIDDDMITRIHMPGPNDKKPANQVEEKKSFRPDMNKGYAYVDFSTEEGVKYAVELSEELLAGRRVLIKGNKSFEGRPEKTKEEMRKDGKPPNKRVFIGNLSYDVSEASLKEHFAKCGPIESAMVATFQDTGKCKGYAWVVFEDLEGAANAVRGFVMVDEEASDVSDSESEDDSDAEPAKPVSKPKKKKWFVNKINGRPVRSEYAEDAQVRYKKRYGKDGTKAAGARADGGEEIKSAPVVAKVVEYRKPWAARLTGGIVGSEGKKTTF